MTPIKIISIPRPSRDHIVGQLMQTAWEQAVTFNTYEAAVKKQLPHEHLIDQLRLLNTRHTALFEVLKELTQYNNQVRAGLKTIQKIEQARLLGKVAQA